MKLLSILSIILSIFLIVSCGDDGSSTLNFLGNVDPVNENTDSGINGEGNPDNENGDTTGDENSLSPDQLAEKGFNLLVEYIQEIGIPENLESLESVEDFISEEIIDEIKSLYFQAAVDLDNDNPSGHLGLALIALIETAYEAESETLISFILELLTGMPGDTGNNNLAGLVTLIEMAQDVIDSDAVSHIEDALTHMAYAVNLDVTISIQYYKPLQETDDDGSPVIDENGLPVFVKDDEGRTVYESEKSMLEVDRTDALAIRSGLYICSALLKLYQAFDISLAGQDGTYSWVGDIEFEQGVAKEGDTIHDENGVEYEAAGGELVYDENGDPVMALDIPSLKNALLAIKYNDVDRDGFLCIKEGMDWLLPLVKDELNMVIADILSALEYMSEETDDQSDDLITEENIARIYSLFFKGGSVGTEEIDKLSSLINSTPDNPYDVEIEIEVSDGDPLLIEFAINLSGFFAGEILDLKQYLPYHYWFYLDEDSAGLASEFEGISNLYGLTLPIPFKTDNYDSVPNNIKLLQIFPLTYGGGLIYAYSSIDPSNLNDIKVRLVLPDTDFGGMIIGLTQTEIDLIVDNLLSK